LGARSVAIAALVALLAVLAPVAARADQPPPAAGDAPAQAGEPSQPQPVLAPSRRGGSTVARIVAPTVARPRLTSRRRSRRLRTETAWSHQPQTLLVLAAATRDGVEWVKVLLPERPNGLTGWILRDDVALSRTGYWVDVRTSARRVTVYRAGRRVRTFRAVVGAPGTPTPRGLAAIYERNRQPRSHGFLGPWALPLTILSGVLESYGGGPGRVAIHGRSGASLADRLGSARSHGCIRVDNRDVSWMAQHVPVATPVRIRL
jgi:lipoprotein-anchoring transpeptidase ErfK/SrfK